MSVQKLVAKNYLTMKIYGEFTILTRSEQSRILGGSMYFECSASVECGNGITKSCSCAGSGTCTQEQGRVSCTCQGESPTSAECPIVGG